MGLRFKLVYHELVITEDIPKLTKTWKDKIRNSIESKLTVEPQTFGKPLRRSLRGYRRLRVGDYRVVYRIQEEEVKIFVIGHRSIVYKNSDSRV